MKRLTETDKYGNWRLRNPVEKSVYRYTNHLGNIRSAVWSALQIKRLRKTQV